MNRYATPSAVDAGAGRGDFPPHTDPQPLLEALAVSDLYRDYQRAFTEATGLPLALRSVDSWKLPHRGENKENPFCAMLASKSKSCSSCLQVQQELSETATMAAKTVNCPAGLCDTAVPIRLGNRLIGFLQTGQVFRKKPTAAQFERVSKLISDWGLEIERSGLEKAYFESRILSNKRHASVVQLLTIFASHLSMMTNQIAMQQHSAEPPVIARARAFIHQHQTEPLTLTQVARATNTSTFYFCKIFKKATGLTFTDYVSRVRIERSRNLLLNRNLRISEIAYEVGFQSLTHFNRVFKKVVGQSPTAYRSQLPH